MNASSHPTEGETRPCPHCRIKPTVGGQGVGAIGFRSGGSHPIRTGMGVPQRWL